MPGAEPQGFLKKGFAGFHAVPRGGAGGMRQGDEVCLMSCVSNPERAPNDSVELPSRHELVNRQSAHAENEFGLENFKLARYPAGAIGNFSVIGNPVAAGRFFAGEAAADGSHINTLTELFLREAATFMEPSEKGLTGGPGEGASEEGFLVAGSLADKDDLAFYRTATDDRLMHFGTKPTRAQTFYMALEFLECGCGGASHACILTPIGCFLNLRFICPRLLMSV